MKEIFLEILAFLGFTEGTKIANEILGLVANGDIQQAINNIANLGNKVSNKRVNEALLKLQQAPQIKTAGLQGYLQKVQRKLEDNYKKQVDLQSDITTLSTNVQNKMNEYANQSGLKRLMEGTAAKEQELVRKYKDKIKEIEENRNEKPVETEIKMSDQVETPLQTIQGVANKQIFI